MSISYLTICATLIIGTAAEPDPLEAIVAATTGGPTWLNGTFPIVDLPRSAPKEVVVAKVLSLWRWAPKGTQYRIAEIKEIHIPDVSTDPYTAVLLKTDVGDRVLLLQYQDGASGSYARWWSQVLAGK